MRKIINFFLPFFVFVSGLLLSACKKDNNTIANVYVDFYIYLTQPSFANLNAVGGWVYVTGGVKGILVFKKNSSEFAAYERNCPYDPNATNARIEVDSSNIIGVDKNCGSKFGLMDNAILNGPATRSMKTYSADYDPSAQTVHVHS
ncbi:MAG: hypothetical protein NT126_01180 [Bacteroidetes bacterium]|nr:hypothetical protein [Bacteroidota bacterium]